MTSVFIRASPITDIYLKLFFLTGCLLMMANCNLFKNTVTDLRKSHELTTAITQVKTAEHKDWLSRSGSVSFQQDSSDTDYSIQIWPKGTFSFSAEKGFSGEADKVLVTGRVKTGSSSTDKRSSIVQYKGKVRQTRTEDNKKVVDQKLKTKRSSPSWKWVIASLAFLGVVSCFLYTKMNLVFPKLK